MAVQITETKGPLKFKCSVCGKDLEAKDSGELSGVNGVYTWTTGVIKITPCTSCIQQRAFHDEFISV